MSLIQVRYLGTYVNHQMISRVYLQRLLLLVVLVGSLAHGKGRSFEQSPDRQLQRPKGTECQRPASGCKCVPVGVCYKPVMSSIF